MQRLNELCGYSAIYDPQPHRARVRPHLEAFWPPCIVGVVLEYVHDDEAAARRTLALNHLIISSEILHKYGWVNFWLRLIEETHAIRVGLRRISYVDRCYGSVALAEDQWGTLYGCRYGLDPTPWVVNPTFRLDTETPPSAAISADTSITVGVDGAALDKWGTLWIDAPKN
jgi:hypothetical protein